LPKKSAKSGIILVNLYKFTKKIFYMKNLIAFGLSLSLLLTGGLACKNNPLAKFTKQYNCTLAGEAEPQTADDFVKRGWKHIENNNYAETFDECAFGAAQEALRIAPQNAQALALRGFLYRTKRDYDSALSDLTEAIQIAPENFLFYNVRSTIYERKEMFGKAIEDLSFVITKTGSHYDYAKRGSLYFKTDDFENALKDYTEAIRLNPDYENHYTMRAEVYRKLGKNDLAEADELKVKEFEDSQISKPEFVYPKETSPPTLTNPQLKDSDSSLPKSDSKTISGGVVNGKATNLVKPAYPAAARAVRASGAVNVQVTIDESGNVISASAVSGHPLLRASAAQAARESKFSPTLFAGKPVKVTGVVVYNFTPE